MTRLTEGERVERRREKLAKALEGHIGYRLYVGNHIPCSLTAEITDGVVQDVIGPLYWVERVKAQLERLHRRETYVIERV